MPLVELYTSQGCSSCPPADRWLSKLKRNPALWEKIVPLAFHVDYWDYIGWRDPYAQPEFGQRQRQYAREGGARAVYTPGMMLNGKDWRGWASGKFPGPEQARTGVLTVELNQEQVLVRYSPSQQMSEKLIVYMTLLGFNMTSNVTAGENRGKELSDDFIVLDMVQAPLQHEGAAYSAMLPKISSGQGFPRLAIAVWVAGSAKQAPLQAAGGWLN